MTDPQPILWRGITLSPHSPGIWLSPDRLWKLTQTPGARHWLASLQPEVELLIVESHETPLEALDSLATKVRAVIDKLEGALVQAPQLMPAEATRTLDVVYLDGVESATHVVAPWIHSEARDDGGFIVADVHDCPFPHEDWVVLVLTNGGHVRLRRRETLRVRRLD